jgi:hypothetical protein
VPKYQIRPSKVYDYGNQNPTPYGQFDSSLKFRNLIRRRRQPHKLEREQLLLLLNYLLLPPDPRTMISAELQPAGRLKLTAHWIRYIFDRDAPEPRFDFRPAAHFRS